MDDLALTVLSLTFQGTIQASVLKNQKVDQLHLPLFCIFPSKLSLKANAKDLKFSKDALMHQKIILNAYQRAQDF
jgi:hypothetical protein